MANMSQRQHHHEQEQKLDENKKEAVAAMKAELESITNINYDCLERISDFLDLENLLNLADTCKRLQIAAAAKFDNDHGNGKVYLNLMVYVAGIKLRKLGIYDFIQVEGSRFCFPFLRCFGAKISKLMVDYGGRHKRVAQNAHLERYIDQYCAVTLMSITFLNKWISSNEFYSKPFKNVTKVEIKTSKAENQLLYLARWFPNLRHLKLEHVAGNETAVAVSFPS